MNHLKNTTKHPFLSAVKAVLRLFFRRCAVFGAENVIPDEPAVFVCNHLSASGPILMSLYFPFPYRPWVHASVMTPELCRDYLEMDFTGKVLRLRPPFSKWAAAAIAPACIHVMRAIDAIPVYRSQMKVRDTIVISQNALLEGKNLVIFPENRSKKFSENINDFHTGFVNLGRNYWRESGKRLFFYPVCIDRNERRIEIGKGISLSPDADFREEKAQVLEYLRNTIDEFSR